MFPQVTEHEYEHKISIVKRTLMLADMTRVKYNKKGKAQPGGWKAERLRMLNAQEASRPNTEFNSNEFKNLINYGNEDR